MAKAQVTRVSASTSLSSILCAAGSSSEQALKPIIIKAGTESGKGRSCSRNKVLNIPIYDVSDDSNSSDCLSEKEMSHSVVYETVVFNCDDISSSRDSFVENNKMKVVQDKTKFTNGSSNSKTMPSNAFIVKLTPNNIVRDVDTCDSNDLNHPFSENSRSGDSESSNIDMQDVRDLQLKQDARIPCSTESAFMDIESQDHEDSAEERESHQSEEEYASEEQESAISYRNSHDCVMCGKSFATVLNLNRHQKRFHYLRLFDRASEKFSSFECRICRKEFSSVYNRRRHEKSSHRLLNLNQKCNHRCSECLSEIPGKTSMMEHISVNHPHIDIQTQTLFFSSLEEFKKWKNKVEKDTASQFSKLTSYKSSHCGTMKFVCHRSGIFISKSNGKKSLKHKGSIKSGFFCPAYIHVKTSVGGDKVVEVTYCSTHLGHECEVACIKMQNRIKSDQNCKLHKCRVCGKMFTEANNRRTHEINQHGLNAKYDLELKCPECFAILPSRKKMLHHIGTSHTDIPLETSYWAFESPMEFNTWKSGIEKKTNTEFVLDLAYRKKMGGVHRVHIQRFNCSMAKSDGSGLFCPASMLSKTNYDDESVTVSYLPIHLGHKAESVLTLNKFAPLQIVSDSHREAERYLKKVNFVQEDENTWVIVPLLVKENNTYEVKRLQIDPDHDCKYKCSSCDVCWHQFTCSCSKLLLDAICEHIHIVCIKFFLKMEQNCSNYSNVDKNSSDNKDTDELKNSVSPKNDADQSLNSLREQALCTFSELLSEIYSCSDERKLNMMIDGLSELKKNLTSSGS